jgi:hypothetical protein
MEQVKAKTYRCGSVDGIPALFHDAQTGGGGKVVSRGDHSVPGHNDRSGGKWGHRYAPFLKASVAFATLAFTFYMN